MSARSLILSTSLLFLSALPSAGEPILQQGSKLVGSSAINVSGVNQGRSVTISGDGNTALVGGSGAVWIFTRSGANWSQQGPKLTGPA